MTRRILVGFLGVLVALLVLVVVPLGLKVSSQQREDFRAAALAEARSVASTEEEHLGDTADAADAQAARFPSLATGDGVVVLGRHGEVLRRSGRVVPDAAVQAIRSGRPAGVHDAVVVTARIGPAATPDGTVVLVRDGEPLDHRVHALWLALTAAACATLAFGAVTGGWLARWIVHPLRDLQSAATRMGHGDVAVRTDVRSGPPEVRAVASAFNEMAERVAALLNSQRTMTADVSHQLRTPLAALQLRLELLADEAPEAGRAELTDALREIGRLNRLLDGLLAVARTEEVSAEREPIDVAGIVAERIQMWRPVAEDAGLTVTSALEAATVRLTPGHLEQVLDNLLANTIEALSPGRRISVSTHASADEVVVTVADDGPGMSPSRRVSALERFEGDGAGRKSGLGLAIVARLIAADHGVVTLEETPGGGLTAVIRFPAVASRVAVARTTSGETAEFLPG